jgi:hypothetical protein
MHHPKKCGEFLGQLSEFQLLKKTIATGRKLQGL